jgi:adenylosuccinate lyase
MNAYVIDSRLFKDQFSTAALRQIFSDENTVQKWLDVEAALAKVEAELGIIPVAAAEEIERKAHVELFDLDAMKREMDRTSHPIVPLIRAIKQLCDGDAGEYVHWGATTQDITDTGMVLQIREALDEIHTGIELLHGNICELAAKHRNQVMVGRSHGQHALPITFGFKVAIWAAEIGRHIERLDEMRDRVLVGQFSGAVGTLAALKENGIAVQEALMAALHLRCPDITWHTARDRIAELICVLAMVGATIGKIAHEVYSLQKTECSELEEPFAVGKVGSSTMPHKRNPPTCETIVAIARLLRGIVPLALEAMVADHERDKIGLQTEREFVARACCLADAVVKKAVHVIAGLSVRTDRMERNLYLQKGLLMSEAVMMHLSDRVGRQKAHELVYEVCMSAFEMDAPLKEALLQNPEINSRVLAEELESLLDPHGYTGSAGLFVDRVLARVQCGTSVASTVAGAPVSD